MTDVSYHCINSKIIGVKESIVEYICNISDKFNFLKNISFFSTFSFLLHIF